MSENDITYGIPESITMWKEDDFWIIKHEKLGVTTQGRSRVHALLMLADAIRGVNDIDVDMMDLSEDVFTMSEEQKEIMKDIKEND